MTSDVIKFQLYRLSVSELFEPRLRLAWLALADYEAERYHGCVPVVLALLDGYANDVDGEIGFSEKQADLSAWDSFAGHPEGLKRLHRVLNKSRRKTHADSISIPYRHGILHGRDLAYDNKLVAAKAWAALFAVGEWAKRIERGARHAPPPKPQKGLRDLFRMLADQARLRQRVDAWKPRALVVGRDVPASGPESCFGEQTPERALVRLLDLWRNSSSLSRFGTRLLRLPRLPRAAWVRSVSAERSIARSSFDLFWKAKTGRLPSWVMPANGQFRCCWPTPGKYVGA